MHFTESELQQHEELIITRALAAKDLALAQANRHKEELFQKLAEKDVAYQQLMEKAVQFARQLGVERVSGALSYIEYPEKAQDFLASPEVQAWKEQQS